MLPLRQEPRAGARRRAPGSPTWLHPLSLVLGLAAGWAIHVAIARGGKPRDCAPDSRLGPGLSSLDRPKLLAVVGVQVRDAQG